MTSGAAMMRFSRGFMRFADGLPVAPVALRVALPWGIKTHTLTSGFLANLFWFSFPPRVRLEAAVLPAMVPAEVRAGRPPALRARVRPRRHGTCGICMLSCMPA
jgi:hypothetical protein